MCERDSMSVERERERVSVVQPTADGNLCTHVKGVHTKEGLYVSVCTQPKPAMLHGQ